MRKHKTKRRQHKLIAFKAYYDTDADILDWWEGIDEGERSEAVRDLIRTFLGKALRPRKQLTIPELVEVRQDTLWIRDALNEMPGYLERVIQQVAANGVVQSMAVGQPSPRAAPPAVMDEPALTNDDAERRTERMRKATW